jgi:ribosome-associated toxin RatA of RatAB toxin-antitoxin module
MPFDIRAKETIKRKLEKLYELEQDLSYYKEEYSFYSSSHTIGKIEETAQMIANISEDLSKHDKNSHEYQTAL